ncbi:DUF3095 domain-containing protein [Phormidium sp. LEGE 05292]|uniref:DUF3095 domain-containing protein n=1 Tax=[Phormidium] sp. LEGE 05292 TaxID=767427 RepID=UPI00187DE09D|nr:DUF3095 domain-containing protein [Phormidium sp. LEGE 05292]MBE9227705.1 DUF3095 domain-containing protein [Phormidium sp. LEGE 05292]
MSSDYFYSQLPAVADFLEITNSQNYVSVPPDWQVIVTDIVGSTKAIESGRYKEVNLIGACSIVAILNITTDFEVPFVFGGDGASLLIPPSLVPQAKEALLATKLLAKLEFQLGLRVGIVPVSVVNQNGYDIKIAKLKISEHYHQAVFTSYGLTHATDLVKNPDYADSYLVKELEFQPKADFSGLECRWQDIPSQHGEIVSILVLATSSEQKEANWIYRQVLNKFSEIYGKEIDFHPIPVANLKLSLDERKLMQEAKVRFPKGARSESPVGNWLQQQWYLSKIKLENYLGAFSLNFKLKVSATDWGEYKNIFLDSTDYKKFDDILRMVIAGNSEQRQQLTDYLETKYQEGKLVYGLHNSDRAIVTCLVFERNGRQVHFVDGADGGYALAAKAMKQRMKVINY